MLIQAGVGTPQFETDTKRSVGFLDRQRLARLSDKVLDLKLVFESFMDTTQKLLEACKINCKYAACSDCQCPNIWKSFQNLQNDTRLNMKKAQILYERIESAVKLVGLRVLGSSPN
jgi:hypothetical protein